MKARLWFVGLDRLGGEHFDVDIPRAPVVGDFVAGPDDFGIWRVEATVFDYRDGFASDPHLLVSLTERRP
jgi:hypothetical protein